MNKMYYNNNAVGIVNHTSVDNQALIGLIQRSATSIDIPSGTTTIGDNAFSSYNNLVSVTIPNTVISIGDSAFSNCKSFERVIIPSGVTSINLGLFQGCTNLKRLNSDTDGVFNLPSGITSIGNYAFRYCYSLTSVTIPDNVTSIGNNAFANCYNLTSIDIPDSVTSIGSYVFMSCTNLASVTINATTPPTLNNANAFQGTPIASGTGYIFVPAGSVYSFKTANYWKTYASQIMAIPT